MTVTMADCIAAGYCAIGTRAWFRSHGMDFAAFLRDGLPLSEVSKIDDAFARRLVSRKCADGQAEES